MTGRPHHCGRRHLSLSGVFRRAGHHTTGPHHRRLLGIGQVGPVTLCVVGIVLGLTTIAAAYVTLIANGTGTAHASAIGTPANFTATSSFPNQATLTWTPPANPSPIGYLLTQSPGTLAGTCTSLTGSSGSCTATGLAPGTQYTWRLTATYDSWSSSTTTATVATGAPSIGLAPSRGMEGTVVAVTGSGFAPSSPVTFSFRASGVAPITLTPGNCTPTTTSTGRLPVGPCEITIPKGSSPGTGTVTVTDAAGNASAAAFTVTAAAGFGTLTVTPASVASRSTGDTLAFTYTASGGALAGGEVVIDVSQWVAAGGTAPQTGSSSAPGYTVASTGSLAYTAANALLDVTAVTLPAYGTLTVTYGSGGGASGVSSPAAIGAASSFTFTTLEVSTASGTPSALATEPRVTVVATGGAEGAGPPGIGGGGTGTGAAGPGGGSSGGTTPGVQPPPGGAGTTPTSSSTATANGSAGTPATGGPAGPTAAGGGGTGRTGASSPPGPSTRAVPS